ncbi:MAG TPA: cupin domain-containing protein [Kofleriaceae bacterium]|nr:cupin domain-containing protein [Kofleriaceae bacterium]
MPDYDFRLDEKFPPLTRFDVAAEAAAHQPWFNQTLARVDDAVLRLGVLEGDFHWHKHDHEDELFLVLEGALTIEIEGREPIPLGPQQAVTVPKGVMHCPHAHGRTVVLMIERATVKPAGD